ncbi:MAG: DUF445 domain-containing protein [SAR324 cluster bacterium]|nr:DUF445 domain-containing protein [SAR324 cluster bacterium]
MNKSLCTNLIAGGVFLIAYAFPPFLGQPYLVQASLFALSGALTNWLAVHMLFEKIPGLYGSGIIPNHFEEFKSGIRTLIMDNFFTEENFAQMTQETFSEDISVEAMTGQIDFNQLFDGFVSVITNSSFGGMLEMLGGVQVLEPLRAPFEDEFQKQLGQILSHLDFGTMLTAGTDFEQFRPKVEVMIDKRLEELTPQQVKEIIDQMIREHLGWLVVWGGVFGAVIGLFSALVLG